MLHRAGNSQLAGSTPVSCSTAVRLLVFPPSEQDKYISLLLHEPTYLEFAGNKHLSCVVFGALEEFVPFHFHLG